MNNLKEHYRMDRNAIEESFINQMCLKKDKEYEEWADNVGIEITPVPFQNGVPFLLRCGGKLPDAIDLLID